MGIAITEKIRAELLFMLEPLYAIDFGALKNWR